MYEVNYTFYSLCACKPLLSLKVALSRPNKNLKPNCNRFYFGKRRVRISSGNVKSVYELTTGLLCNTKIYVRNLDKTCYYSKHRLVAP